MGLWGGLKSIGRGIGKGVKKAGKWVGNEVVRTLDPIRKGIKGDWKGALAGIGHNIKRAAQVAAVAGSGGIAGVGLGTLGAIGGGAEAAFSGKGLKGTALGALGGYSGVQTGKALGNIGRGIATKVGERGVVDAVSGGISGGGAAAALPNAQAALTLPNTIPVPVGIDPSQIVNAANVAGGEAGNIGKSIFSGARDYLSENKKDLLMKGAGHLLAGGNQPAGDGYYPGGDEPMMDPIERARLEREALIREMMATGGSQYRPQSRWA
mgnify:CR=1 FL=1